MIKLSICIPVYNQNVTALLEDLLSQCRNLEQEVEILVFEDGSAERVKRYNAWLRDQEKVNYQDFTKNVGRAAIRNKLGQAANGQNLLFLDDDSRFNNPEFLKNYLNLAQGNAVVCGGREYPARAPGTEYTLHWAYGRKVESRSASERNKNAYDAFHSNNFMVPRQVLLTYPFDESLTEYGHEDTLFGYNLAKNNVPVQHIDNPVIHAQLDSNVEFLEKSKLALQNLWALYQRKDKDFNRSVKILRAYKKVRKLGLRKLIARCHKFTDFQLEQYLLYTRHPFLRLFDLYKLGYFAGLKDSHQQDS